MSWDTAVKQAKEKESGGLFLRLEDGDAAQIVFLPEEPFQYRTVWTGEGSEIFDADKHNAKDAKLRTRFNVYNVETREVQILELSNAAVRAADAVVNGPRDKDGNVDPDMRGPGPVAKYKIRREGSKLKTKYHFALVDRLNEDQVKKISAMKGHELDPSKVEKKDTQDGPAEFDGEDVPF